MAQVKNLGAAIAVATAVVASTGVPAQAEETPSPQYSLLNESTAAPSDSVSTPLATPTAEESATATPSAGATYTAESSPEPETTSATESTPAEDTAPAETSEPVSTPLASAAATPNAEPDTTAEPVPADTGETAESEPTQPADTPSTPTGVVTDAAADVDLPTEEPQPAPTESQPAAANDPATQQTDPDQTTNEQPDTNQSENEQPVAPINPATPQNVSDATNQNAQNSGNIQAPNSAGQTAPRGPVNQATGTQPSQNQPGTSRAQNLPWRLGAIARQQATPLNSSINRVLPSFTLGEFAGAFTSRVDLGWSGNTAPTQSEPRGASTAVGTSDGSDRISSSWVTDFLNQGNHQAQADGAVDSLGVTGADAQGNSIGASNGTSLRELGQNIIAGKIPLILFTAGGAGVILYLTRQFVRDSRKNH